MYRFSLGRLVTLCPQCHRRTFKPYIDNRTGRPLDAAVCGRCNREVKCGYHLPPAQCPGGEASRLPFPPGWHGRRDAAPPMRPDFLKTPPAPTVDSLRADNLFRCMAARFGEDRALAVFTAYRVHHCGWEGRRPASHASRAETGGGTPPLPGGATAFFLLDSQMRCRSAKLMRYNPDGHRRKSGNPAANVTWLHSLMGLKGFRYCGCFFGAHLAAARPDARLVLVESEKTALAMACYDDDDSVVYMATGGASAVNPKHYDPADEYSRFDVLRGRDVVLYPDADMVPRWDEAAGALRSLCRTVSVVDITAPPFSLTASQDMADRLLDSN